MSVLIHHPYDNHEKQILVLDKNAGVGWYVKDKKSGKRVSNFYTSKKDAQYILEDYRRDIENGETKESKEGSYIIN